MSKNYIGISRDHSGSMHSIRNAAMRDYNETIGAIQEQATAHQRDTIVSVVRCGSGRNSGVERETVNSSVSVLRPLVNYNTDGGSTPLFDSVGDLITLFERLPDANEPGTSFLVMAVTDGQDNASRTWPSRHLAEKMRALQNTDRWTFVFRVPRGYSKTLINLGIHAGNIQEWDQTDRGFAEATTVTRSAFTQYYTDLKEGKTATTKFYTDMSNVSVKDIQAALVDVSGLINLWLTTQKESIRPYCERMSGKPFVKGAAFYQLTKTEPEVQDYKQIVIRDKVSGAVYGGAAARDLLGLPKHGMAYVKPGDHGQYDIYIQSTSINRVLPPGTQLLYWPTYMTPPAAPVTAAKAVAKVAAKVAAKNIAAAQAPVTKSPSPIRAKTPVAVPVSALTSAEYIKGYKQGFARGKAKLATLISGHVGEHAAGYAAGYKDGRGKKKNLHK